VCSSCSGHYSSPNDHDEVPLDDYPFENDYPEGEVVDPVPNMIGRQFEGWPDLPEGFQWTRNPVSVADHEQGTIYVDPRQWSRYAGFIQELLAWASENSIILQQSQRSFVDVWTGASYVSWTSRFEVIRGLTEDEARAAGYTPWLVPENIACAACGGIHPPFTMNCPDTGTVLMCCVCGTTPAQHVGRSWRMLIDSITSIDGSAAQGGLICSECDVLCQEAGCESPTMSAFMYCTEHARHEQCRFCGVQLEFHPESEDDNPEWTETDAHGIVCDNCYERLCPGCNEYDGRGRTFSAELNLYVCRRCWRNALAGEGVEEFDESVNMRQFRNIPTIPGRENVRMCGVEIEGASGTEDGSDLALAFYEEGLSSSSEVLGYHHGSRQRQQGSHLVHVEHDSSVDWETVIGPFNPADTTDMRTVNRAVCVIRERVRDGRLGLDLRAGLHVHVGAEQVSLDAAFTLNTLFAYVEDVMFRLGAARWPTHRAVQDTSYTQPVSKETRKLQFARAQGGGDHDNRYYALSFANYFKAMMNSCRCGAVRYDSWEDCTCDLGKCTFEFRLFNTTANPRKLHAYLAICQALVAKALSLGVVHDPGVQFPHMEFEQARLKDMDTARQERVIEMWKERLLWIFTELPLTDAEKASLRYCIDYSELAAVGDDVLNTMVPALVRSTEEVVA
jgi:hypothetical protein